MSSHAQTIRIRNEGQHPLRHRADKVRITDTGGYYTATDVEGALQELFTSSNVLCPDGTSGDFCFQYNTTDSVLELYVNATLQSQWPDEATISYLLLENGDYILLENGDKIILE